MKHELRKNVRKGGREHQTGYTKGAGEIGSVAINVDVYVY